MERGLRQGDSFSPFPFLIVVEALQVLMLEACNLGVFKGIVVGDEEVNISLLQYADDALIFRKWSPKNVKNLISILKGFGDASGRKVNVSKSLLVGKDVSKCASWSNVIERFNNHLPMWKGKLLSIGVRCALSKAVIGRRKFACLGQMESYFGKLDRGGLGIRSIKAKNISLLGKWWWRFLSERDALGRKVIASTHGVNGGSSKGVELRVGAEDMLDMLPLLSNLLRLGINVDSVMCPLCGEVPESIDHIMDHCPKVKPIRLKCFRWWDLKPPLGDLSLFELYGDEGIRFGMPLMRIRPWS
ncbi:reverse transcriptase domain, reverse transcriptase zinc-binding domain protein [Tanacetum coccineum]